jgi:hypothetical protein
LYMLSFWPCALRFTFVFERRGEGLCVFVSRTVLVGRELFMAWFFEDKKEVWEGVCFCLSFCSLWILLSLLCTLFSK